ncbi:MAG: hypothetical protein V7742_18835 [Halioglobus sp.]
MKTNNMLSPQEQLEEFKKKFAQAMKERPHISDEDFMAETEVSDEQYNIGLVLPGVGSERGGEHE